MSVPPLDEPILKRTADPSAGSAIAKHNSKHRLIRQRLGHGTDPFQKRERDGKQDAAISSFCGKFSAKYDHSDEQKDHTCDQVEITGGHYTGFSNKDCQTGDSAKCKVIGKFEKISTDSMSNVLPVRRRK